MGVEDRDWFRGSHPPYCTCVKCTEHRLAKDGIKPKLHSSDISDIYKEINSQFQAKTKLSGKTWLQKLANRIWR